MSVLLSIEAACKKITKRNTKGEIRPVTRGFFLRHIFPLVHTVSIGDRKYIEESEIDLFLIKSRDMTIDVTNKSPEVRKIFNRKRDAEFAYLYDRSLQIPEGEVAKKIRAKRPKKKAEEKKEIAQEAS